MEKIKNKRKKDEKIYEKYNKKRRWKKNKLNQQNRYNPWYCNTHTHTHTLVLSDINKKLVYSIKNIFSNNFVNGTNRKSGNCFKCATFCGAYIIKNIEMIKLQNLKRKGLKYLSRAPTNSLNFFDTG